MGNATQEYQVGDRVRYVGHTVIGVPRFTEGTVFMTECVTNGWVYGVDWSPTVWGAHWPAELERVG